LAPRTLNLEYGLDLTLLGSAKYLLKYNPTSHDRVELNADEVNRGLREVICQAFNNASVRPIEIKSMRFKIHL
jgi:hypothetical protein